MKTLFTVLRKNNISFVGFFIFYLIISLVVPITYLITQYITGEMGQAAYAFDTAAIVRFLILLTIAMGIRAVFAALDALLLKRFDTKVGYQFRVNFAKFFLHQPFAQFEKSKSGKNLSVFTNELPQAVAFVGEGILSLIYNVLMVVIMLGYMFYLHWLFTLIFVVALPVFAAIQIVISIPIQKAASKAYAARAHFNAIVNDSLQNAETIISYHLEDEMEVRYVYAYKKFISASMQRIRLSAILVLSGMVFSSLPLVFLFIASGISVANGNMLISEYIIYTGIGISAASVLMSLAEILGDLGVGKAAATSFCETISGDTEDTGSTQKLATSDDVAVVFENVSFAYDERNILNNLSLSIPQGTHVAIAGESGSGKSTVLKLLLGLYEPGSGSIKVFGKTTEEIGKYALRDAIAYVPQDAFLFPVSICENITGKTDMTPQEQAKLERVCQDAGILDFINSLPDKFDSTLSESADNISGGQRQRIAMARAFYKDAPIILFDEATSALDPVTEADILKTLEATTKDKTVIMVTHRAAAKAFCDTVITLDGGKIV